MKRGQVEYDKGEKKSEEGETQAGDRNLQILVKDKKRDKKVIEQTPMKIHVPKDYILLLSMIIP